MLGLNRDAQAQLRCKNRLAVVPGATHLFQEPGTLTTAAELARDWFVSNLSPLQAPPSLGQDVPAEGPEGPGHPGPKSPWTRRRQGMRTRRTQHPA